MIAILPFRYGKRNPSEKKCFLGSLSYLNVGDTEAQGESEQNLVLLYQNCYFQRPTVCKAAHWEGRVSLHEEYRVFWEKVTRTPLLLTEIQSVVHKKATDTRNKITFRKRKHKLAHTSQANTGKAGSGAALRQSEARWAKMPRLMDVTEKDNYSGDQGRFSAWTRTWTSKHMIPERETNYRAPQDWATTAPPSGREKQVLRTQLSP